MSQQKFQKPPLTTWQHLELLAERGLSIPDPDLARHYLEFVGYYRLSGYFWFFYDRDARISHKFQAGSSFTAVTDLYEFDAALRALLFSAIEKVEVAARAVITNIMCEKYGSHWYIDEQLFKSKFDYAKFIGQVKNDTDFKKGGGRKQVFKSYYTKYSEPGLPAAWMVFDVLSIGTLSKVYEYIKIPEVKKAIAAKFDLPHYHVLSSWLQSISFTRNLCAHHAIVCYRKFHIEPKKPDAWTSEQQKVFAISKGVYLQLATIQYLLHTVAPEVKLKDKITPLLKKYPKIELQKMGFPQHWGAQFIWK